MTTFCDRFGATYFLLPCSVANYLLQMFFLICIECVIFYHFWKKFCSNFCDNFHAFKSSQNFFKSCVLTEMIYQQEIWVHWTTKSFLDTEETSITLWWQKSLRAFKSQREFFRRNTNARMSYFRPFIVITLSKLFDD